MSGLEFQTKKRKLDSDESKQENLLSKEPLEESVSVFIKARIENLYMRPHTEFAENDKQSTLPVVSSLDDAYRILVCRFPSIQSSVSNRRYFDDVWC